MSEPSIGPSSERALKSTARKRGSLPSAWKPPPPTVDGRLFDLAREQVVAVGVVAAVRARLEEGIGPEEVPAEELDLVVRDVAERTEGGVEGEEVVAALLEHDHRPARFGEHVGRGRAGRAGADDDRVAVVGGAQARPRTSSSV